MKYFSQLTLFLSFLSYLDGQGVQTETDVGCIIPGDVCDPSQKCAFGVFDCFDNIYKSKVCDINFFLFTLPADDTLLGLLRGDQVCVSCPYQTYSDGHTVYCGDCIENSGSWESTRICSYDYVIRTSDIYFGAYQQIPKPQNVLFFVIPLEYDKALVGSLVYAPFQTQVCVGCDQFCPTQTLICEPVNALLYSYDLSKQFASCASGYVYSIAIDGCDQCPQNCLSCTITVLPTTDNSGLIVYTTTKICLKCNTGFALFKGFDALVGVFDTKCQPCFIGCLSCYFGSDILNLNQNPDQWDRFVPNMATTDTYDQVIVKLRAVSIEMRCITCQQSIGIFVLPSLTMTTCSTCNGQCAQCEYTSYKSDYIGLLQRYPTQYSIPILNQTQQADYILRCRKCTNYLYTFDYAGLKCDEGSIPSCEIPYYDLKNSSGMTQTTTMDPDFTPQISGVAKCGLCSPQYQLSYDKLKCINTNTSMVPLVPNCVIYDTNKLQKQTCAQCAPGYTLLYDQTCQSGCAFVIGDFFCLSCYSYNLTDIFSTTYFYQKCVKCVLGYYPNIITGKCAPCSQDPSAITCAQCQQYSFKQIYTNTLQALRPSYSDGQIQNFENEDNIISQVICNFCAPNVGFNQYSGYCETCKPNCLKCNVDALTAFCGQCIASLNSRSVTIQGNACIQCPLGCAGCRDRVDSELQNTNPYFSPTNVNLQYFSRICYECSNTTNSSLPIIYNSQIGRCVSCSSPGGCYLTQVVDVYMYCVTGTAQKIKNKDPLAPLYSDLTDYYRQRTEATASISFDQIETNENFIQWNSNAVDWMTINLHLIQTNGSQVNNECVMSKDTYITTGMMRNVFSIINLKLNILVQDDITKKPIVGQSKIVLYIFRNLYLEYFNSVSISGIQISPSVDFNYKYPNISNPDLKTNPFGIIMTLNKRSTLILTNVHILQTQAKEVYDNKSKYVGPLDANQTNLKRFNPFFFNLLNMYQMKLTNVTFTSFSYLEDKEVKFNGQPFQLSYDTPQAQAGFSFTNVTFEDFSMEARYILLLQPMTYTSNDPSIIQKIQISTFILQDSAFINGAGVFSQHIDKVENCGVILVRAFKEYRTYHNSSNGLFNFQTLSRFVIGYSYFQGNHINNTFEFYTNTITMNDVEVLDSLYTVNGHFVHTQEKAPQFRPFMADLSGLTFIINHARFSNITCLSQNCLVYAVSPNNAYFVLMNVTMTSIEIGNLNSSGFAPNLIDSANSATMFISHIYEVTIYDFLSVNNKNLTILNINDVQFIGVSSYTCRSTSQKELWDQKDNMCLYVSNFYQNLFTSQILLQNLVGIDNSFIVFSSWDILVYNTTQPPNIRETVVISDLTVTNCSITTRSISSVSSSLYIKSDQMQYVNITYSEFSYNTHIQIPLATLTPSNPTLLTQSIVGELFLQNCSWKNNKVGGVGATLYIQMGIATISNLVMTGSNWMSATDASEVFVPNSVSYGGHLYLQGFRLSITNTTFQNASAVRGTGLYILAVREGELDLMNVKFSNLVTPLNPGAESQGGCLFIDSSNSALRMSMRNVQMSNCAVRGDGGCFYLKPSSREHDVVIQNSNFYNCFSLGGSFLKVSFDQRTIETQSITIFESQIIQNYKDYVLFMNQVHVQNVPNNGLNAVEQYLFIQRSAAIEQDSGYLSLINVDVSYINFQGFLSLNQIRGVNIQGLTVAHSIIIYRPLIEILNPFLNPTVIDGVQFVNISSYTPEKINCTAPATKQNISNQFKCDLMQIKIEYPDQPVSPAILLVSGVTLKAPLIMSVVSIDSSTCNECFGGLVSILNVYNGDPTKEMVLVQGFTCQNSVSAYYGCLFASSLSIVETSPDDLFLNITYVSSYKFDYLSQTINRLAIHPQKHKDLIQLRQISKHASQQEDFVAHRTVQTDQSDTIYIPANPQEAQIRIQDVRVSELNATYGAAVGIRGLTANVTNLASFRCSSLASGGTLYFQADPKIGGRVFQRLNLLRNSYTEGNASIGGAIRTLESGASHVNRSDVTFLNNRAHFYGNDIGTYPSQMQLIINGSYLKQISLDRNAQLVATPITINSGQQLNIYEAQVVVAALLDEDSKPVNYQLKTTSTFVTKPTGHLTGYGLREFTQDKQGFDYSDLVVNLDPYVYTSLNFFISSDAVFIPQYADYPPYYMKNYELNYTLQGRFRSVECAKGESYNRNDGTCSACGPGTYVLLPKSVCKTMDQSKMNESYLNQISLQRGYWRSDITVDNSDLCFNQLQNCNGGWNVGNDMCTEGNIGALCEACDWYGIKWGQSYSAGTKLSCVKCSDSKYNGIIIGILSIFTLYSIITSIQGTKDAMELQYLAQICVKIGWSSGSKTGANKAIMMKMLTNYQQIIGVIAQFQLTIPSNVVTASQTVGSPTSALGHSMECLLLGFTPGIDILYWRVIWSLILQILYIAAITILLLLGHLTKKLEFKIQYIETMLLFMFIFLHPTYVHDFIVLVSERSISDHPWVQANVSYRYDTWSHQKWMYGLGWPGVVLWAILLPFSFLYVVYHGAKKGQLNNIFFQNSWGFFYNEYRLKCYFWEFVKIFQKELIIIIMIFYTDDVIIKGVLVFLCIYVYGRASYINRPYKYHRLNRLDIWSSNCCCLNIILGVLIYRSLQNSTGYISTIAYIVLGFVNAFFYMWIVYFLLQEYLEIFGEKVDGIRDKIIEKKPELMDNPSIRPWLVNRTNLNIRAKLLWIKVAVIVNIAKDRLKKGITKRIILVNLNVLELDKQLKMQEKELKQQAKILKEKLARQESSEFKNNNQTEQALLFQDDEDAPIVNLPPLSDMQSFNSEEYQVDSVDDNKQSADDYKQD